MVLRDSLLIGISLNFSFAKKKISEYFFFDVTPIIYYNSIVDMLNVA